MRKKTNWIKPGDERVRHHFLLFPRFINHEWRWLEWATWTEEAVRCYDVPGVPLIEWEVREWLSA